ncbi:MULTISPECIES: hypothetical protein [unclassified Rhizobium]|uniref:DUF4376 domain-containing protein n=1 Tax=unclassified Rhizobium TaxID=2613769 RepID=UPI0037F44750
MKAVVSDDMVHQAFGDVGELVPDALAHLSASQLRYVEGAFVDASTLTQFYIEPVSGLKHAVNGDGRQLLSCSWDEPLIKDAGQWRVRTKSDDAAEAVAKLMTYANAKQWSLATGGFSVMIGEQAMIFATDVTSQGLITGKAMRLQQAGAPRTVRWQFASGYQEIAAADFIAASIKIADFVQATFDVLEPILDGIKGGTIKTAVDIDATTWPENHD